MTRGRCGWLGSGRNGWAGAGREVDEKYIPAHNIYEHNRGKYGKIARYRLGTFVRGITVTAEWDSCSVREMK